jgi:deoxyribodipyrimidine photo-lyase
VYCFDDADFVTTRYGFKKRNYRAQFLLESLQDLDANLRKIGSGLMILRGKPEEIPKIVAEYKALKVLLSVSSIRRNKKLWFKQPF